MTKLLLFDLLLLFSFVSVFLLFPLFLTSLIKLTPWLKFFHRQKAGRGCGGWARQGPQSPTLFQCYVALLRIITLKVLSITCNKIVLLAEEHSFRLFFKGYTGAKPRGSETAAALVNIARSAGAALTQVSVPSFMLWQNQPLPNITPVPCIGLHSPAQIYPPFC